MGLHMAATPTSDAFIHAEIARFHLHRIKEKAGTIFIPYRTADNREEVRAIPIALAREAAAAVLACTGPEIVAIAAKLNLAHAPGVRRRRHVRAAR